MRIFITIVAIITNSWLIAQPNIDKVLSSIEENNTTLKALRQASEAQKLENRTGITLPGPEVEFDYMWGKPKEIGKGTNFSVKQSLDIPTITGMKSRLANEKNHLVEWQYKADRMNILLEAKQYCIELIYYNALRQELDTRLEHAKTIAEGYKTRMDQGDANILEYNKVKLNLSTIQGEIARIEVEQEALLTQLRRLNGGEDVVLEDSSYTLTPFPLSFDTWYQQAEEKNPVLAYVKQEIEVSKHQASVNKALALPSFSAGYVDEKEVGERYRGISVGVSIPLWENKNRVKQAKAAIKAAEEKEIDAKQQFYSHLNAQYKRTFGLRSVAENYRKSLEDVNSTPLLKKALDAGEISLLDYIVEMALYYDTITQALEAERDYQIALSELSAVEL